MLIVSEEILFVGYTRNDQAHTEGEANESVYRQQALLEGNDVSQRKPGVVSVPSMWR